jgi:hypothetical protein
MEVYTWAASAALLLASAVSCDEDGPPSVLPGPCDTTLPGTDARAGWLGVPEAAEDPSTRPGCEKAASGLLADFEHMFPILYVSLLLRKLRKRRVVLLDVLRWSNF